MSDYRGLLEDIEIARHSEKSEKNKNMSRSERLQIICACMSGIGKNAIFDKEAVKERIKSCLDIAGDLL